LIVAVVGELEVESVGGVVVVAAVAVWADLGLAGLGGGVVAGDGLSDDGGGFFVAVLVVFEEVAVLVVAVDVVTVPAVASAAASWPLGPRRWSG